MSKKKPVGRPPKPKDETRYNLVATRLRDDQVDALAKIVESRQLSQATVVRIGTAYLIDKILSGDFDDEEWRHYESTT